MRGNTKIHPIVPSVILGLLIVAGIFLYVRNSPVIQAQSQSVCPSGCMVVMQTPDPNIGNMTLFGQIPVRVGIFGLEVNQVSRIYLKAYTSAQAYHVSCSPFVAQTGNYWGAMCDTLGIQTTQTIQLQVHALDVSNVEIPLASSTGGNTDPNKNPRFGTFQLVNTFNVIQPTGTDVSGAVNFRVRVSGDMEEGASMHFVPSSNLNSGTMVPLTRDATRSTDPNLMTEWFVDSYNTADITSAFGSQNYYVFLTFRPKWGTAELRSLTPIAGPFYIHNTCSGEAYTCTSWSTVCVSGQVTRTCTLNAGCPSSSTKPAETQTCTSDTSLPPCPTTMTAEEQWSCTAAWSTCTNNTQTRSCTPNPTCTPIVSAPSSRTCTTTLLPCPTTMTAEEQWICSATWSACLNNTQTRSCTPNTTCVPVVSAPTSRSCTTNTSLPKCPATMAADKQWNCSAAWSACTNNTQTRTCAPNTTCVPVVAAPNIQTCTMPGQTTISAPTITDPVSGSVQKHTLFTVKGRAQPGFSVRVTVDGSRVDGSVNADADGNYYYLLKTPLNPGSHTVFTQALSADGHTSSPPSGTVTVQLAKPVVTIIEPVSRQTVFGDSQRVLAGVDYDDAETKVEFYIRPADATAQETLLCSGLRNDKTQPKSWNCTWKTTEYTDGNYFLITRVTIRTGLVYASQITQVTVQQTGSPTSQPQPPSNTTGPDSTTQAATESIDSDGDGLSDALEAKLETNPNNPDTDADGISDGEEVNNLHTDPLTPNPIASLPTKFLEVLTAANQATVEEPTKFGTLAPEKLQVKTVVNYSPKTGQNNLVISGKGPPNTTLYIYIYSTPVVVTTKTDASGNFTYTLDKNLVDGRHEVYVTVNDQTGKIQEKSAPLAFFVSKAQAVSETDYLRGDLNVSASGDTSMSRYLIIALSAVAAVVVVLLAARYLTKKRKPE